MRILNYGKAIAEWIGHCANFDAFSDFSNWLKSDGAERQELCKSVCGVHDAPQRLCTVHARLTIRNKTQLEASDRETNIERLIKVRRLTNNLAVPRLCLFQVFDRIDSGA